MRKEEMLFITIQLQSFVQQDLAFLKEKFEIKWFHFGVKRGFSHLIRQVWIFVWLIRKIWTARYVYIWFCDYHALLPTLLGALLGKKIIIVIGGFDAVKVPELNYGAHTSTFRSKVIRICCRYATRLWPVSQITSDYLAESVGEFIKSKSTVVPNGVSLDVFGDIPDIPKKPKVMSVGIVGDTRTFLVKGLDRVIDVAKELPQARFVIVGLHGEAMEIARKTAPGNVELHGVVEREDLVDHLASAKIICQLSRMESFGLALAEGMLARCVPVSIAGLGTQEVMGQEGYQIPDYDHEEAVRIFHQALLADSEAGERARQHVIQTLSLDHRTAKMMEELESL